MQQNILRLCFSIPMIQALPPPQPAFLLQHNITYPTSNNASGSSGQKLVSAQLLSLVEPLNEINFYLTMNQVASHLVHLPILSSI